MWVTKSPPQISLTLSLFIALKCLCVFASEIHLICVCISFTLNILKKRTHRSRREKLRNLHLSEESSRERVSEWVRNIHKKLAMYASISTSHRTSTCFCYFFIFFFTQRIFFLRDRKKWSVEGVASDAIFGLFIKFLIFLLKKLKN